MTDPLLEQDDANTPLTHEERDPLERHRAHGRELWRTDGTEEGTIMVKDINPTSPSGFQRSSNPHWLTPLGGAVLFAADDDVNGRQLWRSDGTEAGTFMLAEVQPGGFDIGPLSVIGGVAVFPAYDLAHGMELWRSDGTEAGTYLLADIRPGPPSSLSGTGYDHIDDGRTLFFPANDGTHGNELWKTDGTPAGTVLVKDVDPGIASGVTLRAHAFADGALYFLAHEFTDHAALWRSDGTETGTILVKELPSPGFAYTQFVATGSRLFFNTDDGIHGSEPWMSDGTEAGTALLKDIAPGVASSMTSKSSPPYFSEIDGTVYFTADDGAHGVELWRTDGTEAGTGLLQDIRPGPDTSSPVPLSAVDGALLFRADDGGHGPELWHSGVHGLGAAMVEDIAPGPGGSNAGYPFEPTRVGNHIIFVADDGEHGEELWGGWAAILTHQPRRAVHDLRDEMLKVGLPIGLRRVLGRPLDAAAEAIAGSGREAEAISELERFEAQLNRLSQSLLSDEDRLSLLDFATQIVALLEEETGS